jgi:hypothetical protein
MRWLVHHLIFHVFIRYVKQSCRYAARIMSAPWPELQKGAPYATTSSLGRILWSKIPKFN